jgi:glycosyltransferase involved in cell wall biosynthesis
MPVAVSVVMSVYNDEQFVGQAIKSILDQTFSDFEFIIIDDGSTDHTAREIKKFADPRIRFFQRPNHGLTKSLNFAISVASGKYIARQDSDDYSLPTRMKQQVDFLKTHSEVGLLSCNATLIDENGQVLSVTSYPTDHATLRSMLEDDEARANPIMHGSVMFPKDLASSLGGYRKEFRQSQDLDLWLRMSEVLEIATLSDPLYVWRLRRQSVNVRGWQSQRDFGHLARLCARHRRTGQPEPELSLASVRKKSASKINWLLRGTDTQTEYDFMIALLLFNQDSMRKARTYLRRIIQKKPSHFYAWFVLVLTFLPKKLRDFSHSKSQALYHRLLWR